MSDYPTSTDAATATADTDTGGEVAVAEDTADTTAVATPDNAAPDDAAEKPSRLDRVRARLPEIVTEPQPSLRSLIEHSRHGDWTAESDSDSPVRQAHLAWTYGVAIPATSAAYALQWGVRTPGRALATALALVVLGTALNHLPILDWIIPDFLDITCWF